MTAPAPLLTPRLDPASDTGRPGDKLTSDSTPTLLGTGTPPAGLTVEVWDGQVNRAIATTTVQADGSWTVTTPPLPNGVHQFYAYAINSAGERSLAPSGILQVLISTTPPKAPPAPTLDPGSIGSNAPRINGAGATYNATMHVLLDGSEVGTAPIGGTGTWTFQLPVLSPGTHNVAGQVTDIFGNTGPIGPALTIVIGQPLTVPGAPTAAITGRTVVLSWSTPPDGGSPITGYTVRRDGTVITTQTGLTYTDSPPAGQHSYTVAAVNSVGEGPQSGAVTT